MASTWSGVRLAEEIAQAASFPQASHSLVELDAPRRTLFDSALRNPVTMEGEMFFSSKQLDKLYG